MAKTVEDYLSKHPDWKKSLAVLRSMLRGTELKEEIKWGAPTYTLQGKNVLGVVAFKSYVGLWFHQGVFLKDPDGLLEASSDTTKALRKITFQSLEEIRKNEGAIQSYIKDAIENQKAGKEHKPSKKKVLKIPAELELALKSDAESRKGFDALSPGKQREYAEHIGSASKEATKLRRLEKCLPLIKQMKGLNDKYK
jgi:uncharacterized protein YdeI (YjbR/CyaY-like superfamily)